MIKKYVVLCFMLFIATISIQNCLTDSKKKPDNNKGNGENGFNESFRKTGWITDKKYRAVIFIITNDECKNSSLPEVQEKIRFEAYKNLQKELNPSFNRNVSNLIKNLADNSGRMTKISKDCVDSNIFFYDIEKDDLKEEFKKIKNLK